MKGQHLVIGLVLFLIVIVASICFALITTFNKGEQGMEPIISVVEVVEKIE